MYSAVITKSGQVTLPKELRDFLGVKPGERIVFRKLKDDVAIRRLKSLPANLTLLGNQFRQKSLKKLPGKLLAN